MSHGDWNFKVGRRVGDVNKVQCHCQNQTEGVFYDGTSTASIGFSFFA